jgi:hypothetical protein
VIYLLVGVAVFGASAGGLWVSRPGPDGVAKSHIIKNGLDTWIAVAVTFGATLGIGAIIIGVTRLPSNEV